MKFYKYQGTGNDFVMIDGRNGIRLSTEEIRRLCHRRFGIGADGLIILKNHAELAFEMDYYNADGNASSMCGNGGRCIVKFAHDLGIFKEHVRFMAIDGPHDANIKDGWVYLKMIDVPNVELYTERAFANTGSPHDVRFVADAAGINVPFEGSLIRNAETYQPSGTNVNFVEIKPEGGLFVRTFERGVEDETYSCGTGVTAAALVANAVKNLPSPIKITTMGGELEVAFKHKDGQYSEIFLCGPATKVFEGNL